MSLLSLLRGRKPESTPTRDKRAMCMLLLDHAVRPDAAALEAAFRERFPAGPQLENLEVRESVLTARLGSALAALLPLDMPIPAKELEWPVQTALLWPEAAEVVARHKAHGILTVGGEDMGPLESRVLLSRLAVAVCAVAPVTGVYWGDASAVHAREHLIAEGAQAAEDHPAVMLWCSFHPVREDAGWSGYSLGLEAFGHLDFEIHDHKGEPADLLGCLADAAHYVITTGRELKDGDTFGASADERIPIRHARSRF